MTLLIELLVYFNRTELSYFIIFSEFAFMPRKMTIYHFSYLKNLRCSCENCPYPVYE